MPRFFAFRRAAASARFLPAFRLRCHFAAAGRLLTFIAAMPLSGYAMFRFRRYAFSISTITLAFRLPAFA